MTINKVLDDGVSVVELSSGVPTRGSRRTVGIGLGVAVALALIAGAVLLARPDANRAESALARAQSFVEDTTSYTFEADVTQTFGGDVSEGPGSVTTSRTHDVVEVAGVDRWHVVSDSGDYADEMLRIDDTMWNRSAGSRSDLADELWAAYPAGAFELSEEELQELEEDEEAAAEGLQWDMMDGAMTAFLFAADPLATVDLIKEATDPQVLAADSAGTTLQVSAEGLADLIGDTADTRLELDLDRDDVPTALRIEASDDEMVINVEIRFTGWNPDLDLRAPNVDMIDATPWVDEESVLAYTESEVFAPTVLPEGFELSGIEVWYAADDDYQGCDELALSYLSSPNDPAAEDLEWDFEYFDVMSTSAACALEHDDTTFEHEAAGRLSRHGGTELRIGDTVIRIDSTLPPAETATIIESLARADIPTLLEAYSAKAAEYEGLTFGL